MDAVSERLKFARQKAKLTQEELANAISTHKNTIGRWERGLGEPDAKAITSICEVLGLSPYWLLSGEGPMLSKDREIKFVAGTGTKAGDLRKGGYKFSEVSGGPAFDTSAANLQAKWREIASALPEDSKDADMEKAFLYHQVKLLESELAETKEALLKAKDEAISAQSMALRRTDTLVDNIMKALEDRGLMHTTEKLFEAMKSCSTVAELEKLIQQERK